ncbi:MAG: YlmC/YmxH family sporulation protein [Firmicutes bacterium]|nr:YlmC/YmxH family sporulation protein [Bacillota bacterium]
MFCISELKNKDIVNSLDGKKLGYIKDVELNIQEGRVTGIIIPSSRSFISLFNRENDIIIKWQQILKIGVDVIIVELPSFASLNPYVQSNELPLDDARWLLKGEE